MKCLPALMIRQTTAIFRLRGKEGEGSEESRFIQWDNSDTVALTMYTIDPLVHQRVCRRLVKPLIEIRSYDQWEGGGEGGGIS